MGYKVLHPALQAHNDCTEVYSIRFQCVFDYATRGHFIVAYFEITLRSSFGVCHCRVGRNTTVLAPDCGLAICNYSKPMRSKKKVPRPTETVFANSAIKHATEKRRLFSYASLHPLQRETFHPPERWCSRHPRRQTTFPPHGLSIPLTPPEGLQPNQCFSRERPSLTRPHGRCQLQVEPHAAVCAEQRRSSLSRLKDAANTTGEVDDRCGGKGRGQAGGSLMVGGWCAVRWRRKLSQCTTTGAHALCLSQQSHGMTSLQCV